MPLDGSVFLALWNDFAPERDDEYERWHSFEHVPERVGVPDMIRGRRYRAPERGVDRFFTLYELTDGSVLTSAPYLDLVRNPTDWSRDMRPHFRNVVRMPCTTLASVGSGIGGHVATARLRLPGDLTAEDVEELRRLAHGIGEAAPATAFHAGAAIPALSDYPVFKNGQTAPGPDAGTLTLVAEAGSREAALDTALRAARSVADQVASAEILAVLGYDLVLTVAHEDLDLPPNGRLAPRPDLRDAAALRAPSPPAGEGGLRAAEVG